MAEGRKKDFIISFRMKGTALNFKTMNKNVDDLKERIEKQGYKIMETRVSGETDAN